MRPKSARSRVTRLFAAPAPIAQVLTHECQRCGELHNGPRAPSDWLVHPEIGLLCGSCDNTVALSELTGAPVHKKAA